jgi:glucokinase
VTTRTAIGIDIGGTHLRAARVCETGEVLAAATAESARDAETVVARCLDLVARVTSPDVSGIGIGVPGQVLADSRRVLSGGYVDLSGIGFAERIEQATGLPVTIENDASMALLGEAAHGAARGFANVVMLTIGTGIGGAVLERGRLLRGRGTAGQLGHLTVVPGGRDCVCGRKGCVETESSGTAFGIHLAEAGLPPGTRAEDLLAGADDPLADRVLTAWATPLRAAIDSLIATCAPDLVVLGGGAGAAAAAALTRLPTRGSWFDAPVVAAGLRADAGIIGAAMAALPRARRAVLVNGVPASGKSQVARALSAVTGWHVLALDTVKTPFLAELAPVDRLQNRTLGRASYAALFDLIADMPPGSTAIIDAWFGFQPPDLLEAHLARAGVADTLEIWCTAPPDTVGARYAARAGTRPAGHPGLEYVPELVALARRAAPNGRGPVLTVDTTVPADAAAIAAWIAQAWPDRHSA